MLSTLFVLGLFALSYAAPTPDSTEPSLGLKFDKRDDGLPTLTLPYGTWRAANYDANGDIYTFKNIRFGAPPVGDLRWAEPATPAYNATIQDGSYGPVCHQSSVKGLNLLGPGNQFPAGSAANQFLGGIPLPLFTDGAEDCLFLDINVPGKAVRNETSNLPVIVWFFGGAFVFGAKDALEPLLPFYDGTGLVRQSGGEVIFVAGNYRVGAFGFLAGTTMEQEGLPNTGLHDQRAVLQWVQDYIGLLNGDKATVSAWGESAGASSILHHLVQKGGTQDPLFKRAVVLSPAYEVLFDRRGQLDNNFKTFAQLAGCKGQGVACLRAASEASLASANAQLGSDAPDGTFPVGPAPDGNFIRQLPTLELKSGNYWKGLDSIIISHVSDEAEIFVDGHIQTDQEFDDYIDVAFPNYTIQAGVNAIIEKQYPPPGIGQAYLTETDRVKALVQDISFTCNTRYLSEAYAGVNYNLQYSVTPGWHATDLLPTFYNADVSLSAFGASVPFPLIPIFGGFAEAYQSYLVSHAMTGDPNSHRLIINVPPTIPWGHPDASGNEITGVLNAGDLGFSYITDTENTQDVCDFWVQVEAAASAQGGYDAPGAVVNSSLVTISNNPSVNYTTPSS